MKAFIFAYATNYDLGAVLIYAESKEEAILLADKSNYVWDTNNIYEINTDTTSKIIVIRESEFVEEILE